MVDEKKIVAQLRQDRNVLWIALACGTLAASLLYFYLLGKKEPYGKLISIAVANTDLSQGQTLSKENVAIEERPAAFASSDNVIPADANYILGKPVNVAVSKGQPILWSYIRSESGAQALSAGLNAEYNERAVTITVDEIKGVAGYLKPNDRVDVIGTFNVPGKTSNSTPAMKAKTLLQCVTVLAAGSIGQSALDYNHAPASVTLKVTPQEAALLTFAETVGQLRLMLRNPDDLKVADEAPEVDFSNIYMIPTVSRERRESLKIVYGMNNKKF